MPTDSAIAYDLNAQGFLNARDHSNIGADVIALWCRTLVKEGESSE
jgi:hypothetical protein